MGCTPSRVASTLVGGTGIGRRAGGNNEKGAGRLVVDKWAPPPSVPLSIGRGVRFFSSNSAASGETAAAAADGNHQPALIFIFGGPGSQKGLVVEELIRQFDFVAYNVEQLVLEHLPERISTMRSSSAASTPNQSPVPSPMPVMGTGGTIGGNNAETGDRNSWTTAEMQDMIRRNPQLVPLSWVLSLIVDKLREDERRSSPPPHGTKVPSRRILIDLVPTLACLLRHDALRNPDKCSEALAEFEKEFRVMAALELHAGRQQLVGAHHENTGNHGGKHENGNGADDSSGVGTSSSGDEDGGDQEEEMDENERKKTLSAELSAFLRGVDEADKGRLEKRLEAYNKFSTPFLKYFSRTRRIVRLDIESPQVPNVVSTVHDMMADFGFSSHAHRVRVILLASGDDDYMSIDFDYYRMRRIALSDVPAIRRELSLEEQMSLLRDWIDTHAKVGENFAILLDAINNAGEPKQKRINFLERRGATFLDEFIRRKLARQPLVRQRVAVHSICTASGDDDEQLLFLDPFPMRLARKIGVLLSTARLPQSDGEKTPSPRPDHITKM